MEHSGPGGVAYTAFLCQDCITNHADMSRIVCIKCLRLQGFITPQKTADGFEYVKRGHYHIDGCPRCVPGKFETPVIEHRWWLRQRGAAVKRDLDLVQEIEQKSLQAEKEVDNVRQALNSAQST